MTIVRGWPVSPFTEKTLAYLKYRGEPFQWRVSSVLELYMLVRRRVGRIVMPTVTLSDGTWLQDTSDITDHFEAIEPHITPERPLLQFLSGLLELFGDEWLIIVSMQTRWKIPGNPEFAIGEFGRDGFPLFPQVFQRLIATRLAQQMQAHLPRMGLTQEMGEAFLEMADDWMQALDTHLETHDYLLGGRPCQGDFACMGPLYSHLWRDPHSRTLVTKYKHVTDWMMRVQRGDSAHGDWIEAIPETLYPVLEPIFTQTLPWTKTVVEAINTWCAGHPGAVRVPRALGWASFQVNDVVSERKLITYIQWLAQRPLQWLNDPEVQHWMAQTPAAAVLNEIDIKHPMKREQFREVLAQPVPS